MTGASNTGWFRESISVTYFQKTYQEEYAIIPKKLPCPLCGCGAILKYQGFPGYREPQVFDIYSCTGCNASFVDPRDGAAGIYDLIYRNAGRVIGYDRYYRYVAGVLESENPLSFLAEQEDAYWAVGDCLRRFARPGAKVLEIGSGFGYLTYALFRSGYDATGLDISSFAVDAAGQRFGGRYLCDSVENHAASHAGTCDFVVSSNVIEHVPDVKSFLSACITLLKKDGVLVITTDNRDFYPHPAIWNTDLPPVHLYWFSELSMEGLAAENGCDCSFVDFKPYNRSHKQLYQPRRPPFTHANMAVFDRQGMLMPPRKHLATNPFIRPLPACRKLHDRVKIRMLSFSRRRGTLCAIMRKK